MTPTTTTPSSPFPLPSPNQPYLHVSPLEAGYIEIATWEVISGANEDDVLKVPSLAFVLKHSESGKIVVFDLGVRRESEGVEKGARVPVTADEALRKGGVDPESVDVVVLSHLHWDHVGDHTAFPNAAFILGPGSEHLIDDAGVPEHWILPKSVPTDKARLHILQSSAHFQTSIGPFPEAYDYFSDGSLYIINAPGHLPGHINILARTSSDGSWILLAGDSAHDVRLLTGEKEMAYVVDGMGRVTCMHSQREDAGENIKRIGGLLKEPRVEVVIAHDWEWLERNRSKGTEVFFPGVIPPK